MLRLVQSPGNLEEEACHATLCEFCGATLDVSLHGAIMPVTDNSVGSTLYFLSPAREERQTVENMPLEVAPPMVIFCVDISASMSNSLKLEGGGSMTRLECVQKAVVGQLNTLHLEQPECIVVIVTFGAEVCVYTDGVTCAKISCMAHGSEVDLLAKGKELNLCCSAQIADSSNRVKVTVSRLKPQGNTALGPALAVSVGMASGRPGSKIVLCTDGMANNGVGAIQQRGQILEFYGDMGRRAAEEGTCISVITMEGEDCSMENLGACADLTGGQVEMVDLQELSTKVGAMLKNPTLGTSLEVDMIAGPGISFNGDFTSAYKGNACTASRTVGIVTSKTDLTLDLRITAEDGDTVPVQLQLRYTKPDGEEVLQVLTVHPRVCSSRDEAESDINGTCVALNGIHSAARLAQNGNYRSARAQLISTCRLLQRAMNTMLHQESYLSFIIQAEKLDGFMRERESQDKILGSDGSLQCGRDDDASRSMYQMKSLSVDDFNSRS